MESAGTDYQSAYALRDVVQVQRAGPADRRTAGHQSPDQARETDGLVDSNDPWFFRRPAGAEWRHSEIRTPIRRRHLLHHAAPAVHPSLAACSSGDRNASLSDPTKWATETASPARGERMYYITDPQGSVMGSSRTTVSSWSSTDTATVKVPFGLPGGNVKSDGVVNAVYKHHRLHHCQCDLCGYSSTIWTLTGRSRRRIRRLLRGRVG